MVIDIRDRWVICMPTKTGTTSLTALLTKRVSSCGVQLLPKHAPNLNQCEGVPDRLLTVRHPLDRFCSMYYHLQREGGRGRAFALESIDSFAAQVVARSTSVWDEWSLWSWSLTRYVEVFKPTSIWDCTVDDGAALCKHLAEAYGYDVEEMPHLRKSKDRDDWRSTVARMDPAVRSQLEAWAEADMKIKPANLPEGYSF